MHVRAACGEVERTLRAGPQTGRVEPMGAVEALTRLGGVASAGDILELSSRRRLRTAVQRKEIHRRSRDRYVLTSATRAAAAAARMHGVVSHLDAALHWGWQVKTQPERPHVTVPRNRKVSRDDQAVLAVHWRDLAPGDVTDSVTSPVRTVLDCGRDLPFDEALAVADSALRSGVLGRDALVEAAARLRGPGSARARRVAACADARAANPFESVLRAVAMDAGLAVVAQYAVQVADGRPLHPDLADPLRAVVLEADSWGEHAGREAHDRDCTRYNLLTLAGWTVLRFTWEQVMLSPSYVRWVLGQLDEGPAGRARPPGHARRAA